MIDWLGKREDQVEIIIHGCHLDHLEGTESPMF